MTLRPVWTRGSKISVVKNTSYNLVGSVVSILTMVVTIPVFLSIAGIERYGVYTVAVAFLGYFGLFDLGVSRATARKISEVRRAASESVGTVMWTGLSISLVFSALGGIFIIGGANAFFAHGMILGEGLALEARGIGPLLGMLLPLTLLSGMFMGMLQGFEQFFRLNLVVVLGVVLTQVFPLVAAALAAPTLEWLLIGLIVARAIALAALVLAVATSEVRLRGRFRPSKALAGELMKFGGWVSVTAIIGPLLTTIDRMAIGAWLGPAAVAVYTIPFGLVRRVEMLPFALASAIFPRLVGERDPIARERLAAKSIAVLAAAVTPMIVCGGLALEPFLALWIDAEFAREAAPVGTILLAAFWAKSQVIPPFELLTARGHPDLVAKLHLAEVGPYLALLAAGIYLFGVEGAAGAWTLRALADCGLLYFLAGKHAGLKARPPVFAPAALIIASIAVIQVFPLESPIRWGAAVLVAAASLAWGWAAAPEELRRRVLRR